MILVLIMAFCRAWLVLALFFFCSVNSKVYDRCELAIELRDVYEFSMKQLSTWVCIANYESHYNTSAHNPGSGDHGLFQISELYWCSPGMDLACAVTCSALKDDDIEDDVVCAKRIFRQHQRISGDGFTAWVVYNLYCKNKEHADKFLNGCFTKDSLSKYSLSSSTQEVPKVTKTTSAPATTVTSTAKSTASVFSKFGAENGLTPKTSSSLPGTKSSKLSTGKLKLYSGTPLYYTKQKTPILESTSLTSKPGSTLFQPSKASSISLMPKREEKRENQDVAFSYFFGNRRNVDDDSGIRTRETKNSDFSFTINDKIEQVYSMVNRPDFQFALTSRGFRFART